MADNRQSVAQQFMSILGRQASGEELSYLTKFLDDGDLSAAEVGQFLQSTPEYQDALLKKQGGEYSQMLAQGDEAALGQAQGVITSNLARAGRSGSSALQSGLAQAAGGLAQRRQSALAEFYGRGLRNNAGMTATMGQGALNRGYGLRDERRQRNYSIEDYYRQKNDYEDAKNASSGFRGLNAADLTVGAIKGIGNLGAAYLGGRAYGAGMKGGLF